MYLGQSAVRGARCSQPPSLREDYLHFATKLLPSSWVTLSKLFH